MVMKLRKKPVEVEGVRWTGTNVDELRAFVGDKLILGADNKPIIKTLEGDHDVCLGAVVVKGVEGEFYPVDPEIFPQTFIIEDAAALEALSAAQRTDLKDSEFAVPDKRKLPINDEKHIRLAWDFLAYTKDLTDAEQKHARGAILAAAKKHDMDISKWKWASLEDDQAVVVDWDQIESNPRLFPPAISSKSPPLEYPAPDAVPYLLNQGAEEACELGQAFAKALRFGLDSVDPKSGETPRERVRDEANDVLGLLFIVNDELSSRGIAPIEGVGDPARVEASVAKRLGNLQNEYEAGRYSLPIPSTKEA